jgi:hypothetical protein
MTASPSRNRKRLLKLALLLSVIAIPLYVISTLPPAEPRYQGNPLRYWLSRTHNQSLPPAEQARTRVAVSTIGTNNLPLLLKWFIEDEPPGTEPAYRKALDWLRSRFHTGPVLIRTTFRPSRPGMAFWVFSEFPDVASAATPHFIAMLTNKEDLVKGKAALILAKIGPAAAPALLDELSNTNDVARALAAWDLGDIGADPARLRPRLEAMLNDKASCVRLNAAISFGKLGGTSETFVPVILRCVHEADEDTRMFALDALGKFKDHARSAVPDLTNTIATATNTNYRYALLAALREIDPEQPAKFDPVRPADTNTPPPEEPGANPNQLTAPGKP